MDRPAPIFKYRFPPLISADDLRAFKRRVELVFAKDFPYFNVEWGLNQSYVWEFVVAVIDIMMVSAWFLVRHLVS